MIDIYKANSYDEAIEFNGEIKNPYKKFLNFLMITIIRICIKKRNLLITF